MKTIKVADKNSRLHRISAGDVIRFVSENGESVYVTATKSYHLCDGCVFKDRQSDASKTIGSCVSLGLTCAYLIFVDTRAIMEEL